MVSNIVLEHRRKIDEIANQYDKRGYDVIVEPAAKDLPQELSAYHPDLIAISPNDKVLVEVKLKGKVRRADYWKNLQESVQQVPGWHLQLVISNASEAESVTIEEIDELLKQSRGLAETGALVPALLIGWSGAEAALRAAVESHRVEVPDYHPSTLISQLYTEGLLDDEVYQVLRNSLDKRNALSHGFRETVGQDDIDQLNKVVKDLLRG